LIHIREATPLLVKDTLELHASLVHWRALGVEREAVADHEPEILLEPLRIQVFVVLQFLANSREIHRLLDELRVRGDFKLNPVDRLIERTGIVIVLLLVQLREDLAAEAKLLGRGLILDRTRFLDTLGLVISKLARGWCMNLALGTVVGLVAANGRNRIGRTADRRTTAFPSRRSNLFLDRLGYKHQHSVL
jgi:hypothetical protein